MTLTIALAPVDAVGAIATVVSVASFLPQLVKSWRSKSTHDLSLAMWALFCLSEALWLGYGLLADAPWMALATTASMVIAFAILMLKRRYGSDATRFVPITAELKRVVQETEAASGAILSAAERLEEAATTLRGSPDPVARGVANLLGQQATAIFEACNFQDIEGQRIARIVRTFEFIEARDPRLREVWEQAQRDRRATGRDGDPAALGPATEGEGRADQTDIDRMFD